MIKLGQKAKDKVTGFTGIITARASYLTGCDQYVLTPTVDEHGKTVEGQWFDESRIKVTGEGVSIEDVVEPGNPGGPQQDAPQIK